MPKAEFKVDRKEFYPAPVDVQDFISGRGLKKLSAREEGRDFVCEVEHSSQNVINDAVIQAYRQGWGARILGQSVKEVSQEEQPPVNEEDN